MVDAIPEGENLDTAADSQRNYGVRTFKPKVVFVDRFTFDTVLSGNKGFKAEDFIGLVDNIGVGAVDVVGFELASDINDKSVFKKVSDRLRWYIRYTHAKINHALFKDVLWDCDIFYNGSYQGGPNKESMEYKNMVEVFEDRLLTPVETCNSFYEILPIGDGNILIIMENGFLHYLTQSKSTAQAFVLHCLGELDRFKTDKSGLNKLYLDLGFIDNYVLLIKARLG